jgi:hypothetical protein
MALVFTSSSLLEGELESLECGDDSDSRIRSFAVVKFIKLLTA